MSQQPNRRKTGFTDEMVLAAVDKLERTSRKRSRLAVLELLDMAPQSWPVQQAVARMKKCRSWGGMRLINGRPTKIRIWCGLPMCPSCFGRERDREAAAQWRKLQKAVGRRPAPCRMHFITIRWEALPFGSDFRPSAERFRKSLRNTIDRLLPGSLWSGQFEIGERGMLHLHAWVYSDSLLQRTFRKTLQAAYPGDRRVSVGRMKPGSSSKNFLKAAGYAADISLWVRDHGIQTPQVLHDLLHSTLSMITNGGRVGLRFEVGLRQKATSVVASQDLPKPGVSIATENQSRRIPIPIDREAGLSLPVSDTDDSWFSFAVLSPSTPDGFADPDSTGLIFGGCDSSKIEGVSGPSASDGERGSHGMKKGRSEVDAGHLLMGMDEQFEAEQYRTELRPITADDKFLPNENDANREDRHPPDGPKRRFVATHRSIRPDGTRIGNGRA